MSLHPASESGTPIYTYGWSTVAGFPATEKGLSIYLWGWFGGQPNLTDYPDEVSFACGIGKQQDLEASIQQESAQMASIQQEELVQTGLGRNTEQAVNIGRELISEEVER